MLHANGFKVYIWLIFFSTQVKDQFSNKRLLILHPGSGYCVNTSTAVEENSRTEKHKLWFEAMSEKSKTNENSLHADPVLINLRGEWECNS